MTWSRGRSRGRLGKGRRRRALGDVETRFDYPLTFHHRMKRAKAAQPSRIAIMTQPVASVSAVPCVCPFGCQLFADAIMHIPFDKEMCKSDSTRNALICLRSKLI